MQRFILKVDPPLKMVGPAVVSRRCGSGSARLGKPLHKRRVWSTSLCGFVNVSLYFLGVLNQNDVLRLKCCLVQGTSCHASMLTALHTCIQYGARRKGRPVRSEQRRKTSLFIISAAASNYTPRNLTPVPTLSSSQSRSSIIFDIDSIAFSFQYCKYRIDSSQY